MLSLDPQLRRYAWVTGIRNVAFLWLIKTKTNSFKKGDTITLLQDVAGYKAGQELVVAKYDSESDPQFLLGDAGAIQKLEEELKAISGKGATAAKESVTAKYLCDGLLCAAPRDAVTKTKIQWIEAEIPESELPEIGEAVGHEMVSIIDSVDKDRWTKDGGVRFPNNQCTWCAYRGICTGNNTLRDELLVQISSQKEDPKEEDWLSELEA